MGRIFSLKWILGVLVCSSLSALAQTTEAAACQTATVKTTGGPVCGKTLEVEGKPVLAFLGIPFAESTAGPNRFQPPVPKAPWTAPFQATQFGNICPQNDDTPGLPSQSEDCLSINIWTPNIDLSKERLPVMVYIYGGAFQFGASAMGLYDGSYLAARHNMVVVSFNYRSGALGFLAGVGGLSGNYGFLDQQLALKWVNQNITDFGGNPGRVTLAGESAGAMSVGLHLFSAPASQPLFQQVVLMSNPLGIPYRNLTQARQVGLWYLTATGCYWNLKPADCLRRRSVSQLLQAEKSPALMLPVLSEGLSVFLNWAPVIDGSVLKEQPLVAAQQGGLTKPAIIGTNQDEAIVFLSALAKGPIGLLPYTAGLNILLGEAAGAKVFASYSDANGGDYRQPFERFVNDYLFFCSNQALARTAKAPVYLYRFTHAPSVGLWKKLPACQGKACHSEGVAFAFHTLSYTGATTPGEDALSRDMADYLGQFVNAQPLKGASGLEWPNYAQGNEYLRFAIPTQVFKPDNPNCALLDSIGYSLTSIPERVDRTRRSR